MKDYFNDYFGLVEIGGLAESPYHNVCFKHYYLNKKSAEYYIIPEVDFDGLYINMPTDENAKDLLLDLCNLYNRITNLNDEDTANTILEWCNQNAHPYNTDELYEMLAPADGSEGVFSKKTIALATIPVSQFKSDLIRLVTHFNYMYAFDMVKFGRPEIAMDLYKKYSGWSEYDIFEKYKKKALTKAKGDEAKTLSLFSEYVLADEDRLTQELIDGFVSFNMSIKKDRVSKNLVHSLDVNSIFDIAWFAFSKIITEDAAYVKFEDANYTNYSDNCDENGDQFPIGRCPICGDYIVKIKNRKYCDKEECQRRRKAIKSRNYTMRKKAAAIKE